MSVEFEKKIFEEILSAIRTLRPCEYTRGYLNALVNLYDKAVQDETEALYPQSAAENNNSAA